MKVISDIRIFKSDIDNIDGNAHPSAFLTKEQNIIIHRIVMKLREQGFSLGEFDHLYLNFTTCLEKDTILPAKRRIDPYHKWYRYYDVGVDLDTYGSLGNKDGFSFVAASLEKLLEQYFPSDNSCFIHHCISEALDSGEEMLILYKTKQSAKLQAKIYLQYLNNGHYRPQLSVRTVDGMEVLRAQLPESVDLMSLGEIQLSSKKVVIKPRKNGFTKNRRPMVFELVK